MKSFRVYLHSLRKVKINIFFYIVMTFLLAYLTTYIPIVISFFMNYIMGEKIDTIFLSKIVVKSNMWTFIISICIILIIIELCILLFSYIKRITQSKIIQSMQYELKIYMFNHIQNLTYHDFYKNSLSDLIQKSTSDVNKVVDFVNKQLTFFIEVGFLVVLSTIQLINLDYRLSLTMIISILIMIFISIIYYKKSRPLIQEEIHFYNNLYTKMENNFSNNKFIKINNLEKKEKKDFSNIVDNEYRNNRKKVTMITYYHMGIESIINLQQPLIFLISTYLLYNGLLSVGAIFIALTYSYKVTKSFNDTAEMISLFNSFIVSNKRISSLLALTDEDKDMKDIKICDHTIVFRDVSIVVNEKTILRNLNFRIEENERVFIVGSTGSGKTILLKTLIGFYEYTGSITIGGVEVRELNKKFIRDKICLLLQDSYIFSKTIAENIKILHPYLPIDDIVGIAQFFMLHDDIVKLEDSYDSPIGRKGISLSKGQNQRLILSRSFIKVKSIMILDDSFSAIDNINKSKILGKLLSLKKQFSLILISYDLKTIDQFDKVIFLSNQEAIVNSHNELVKNKDYKRIYDISINRLGDEYV